MKSKNCSNPHCYHGFIYSWHSEQICGVCMPDFYDDDFWKKRKKIKKGTEIQGREVGSCDKNPQ